MSTLVPEAIPSSDAAEASHAEGSRTRSTDRRPHVTFAGVARSEWIKAASARSSLWSAGLALGLTTLFGAGLPYLVAFAPSNELPDPVTAIVAAFGTTPSLGVLDLVFMVATTLTALFSVLITTTERSTGLLAATLATVPRRTPVFLAKLLVSAVVAMAVGFGAAVTSFLAAQPALAGFGLGSSPADPLVIQVMLGGVAFLGLIAVLSTALASMFRGTAGGMGAVLGLLLIAPGLVPLIPGVGDQLAGFLPSTAGGLMFQPVDEAGWAATGIGALVLFAWAAVSAVVAGAAFTRRDV